MNDKLFFKKLIRLDFTLKEMNETEFNVLKNKNIIEG